MARSVSYECRTLHHAWSQYVPGEVKEPPRWNGDRYLFLRCDRCTTTRHDFLTHDGDIEYRRYDYVEGYQLSKDLKPSTAALRLMFAVGKSNGRRKVNR